MWYVLQTQSRMPTSCSMAASEGMFVHSGVGISSLSQK